MNFYNNDFDEYFIPYRGKVAANVIGWWVTSFKKLYKLKSNVFLCPSSSLKHKYYQKMIKLQGKDYANYFIDYGYNFRHIGSSLKPSGSYVPAKLSQLKVPSKTICMLDAGRKNINFDAGAAIASDYPSGYEQADPYTHQGKIIINWVDGHASQRNIKHPANPYTDADLGISIYGNSFWNRK